MSKLDDVSQGNCLDDANDFVFVPFNETRAFVTKGSYFFRNEFSIT